MREALSFSAELHANKQANRRKQQQQQEDSFLPCAPGASKISLGDEDEDEDGDDVTADALSELRDLLKESDEMPVYMEEAVLLKCQLQALEWANKAALILPPTASLYASVADMDTQVEQDQMGDEASTDILPSFNSSTKSRPRLAEVQRLAKEIKK